MNAESASKPSVPAATWIGLAIALFAMLVVRQLVSWQWPTPGFESSVAKELGIWACATTLIIIIWKGERLPLTSIGIGTAPVWKSLLWGLVLMVVCFLVAGVLVYLTHYGHGENIFDKIPGWLVAVICFRAGVVEELFYRGYAIERLQSLGLNRYAAAAVPLVIFGIGHWTGGWANIVIALALGALLSAFYLWRRDLVANMFAHFLVDFIANLGSILPQHKG